MSNNIKWRQNSLKRIKKFEYLRNNLGFNRFFLLETHSSVDDEKKWTN